MRTTAEYERDCALADARMAEKAALRTNNAQAREEYGKVYAAAKKRARAKRVKGGEEAAA